MLKSELKQSIERLRAAEKKLENNPEKLKKLFNEANALFYKDPARKKLGDEYQALERIGKAHQMIQGALELMNKGGCVSGIHLYSLLEGTAQVFPLDADLQERRSIFMAAALKDVVFNEDSEDCQNEGYGDRIAALWKAVEPSAAIAVAKQAAVNNVVAQCYERGK